MRRWLPAVLLLVVLLLSYVALWSSPDRERSAAGPGAVDEAPAPGSAAVEAPAVAAAPQAPSQAPDPAADEPAPPAAPPEGAWKPLGDPTGTLKAAFEVEPRDALWAEAMERSIDEVLADDELPEGFAHEASCRRTVCRIDIRFGGAGPVDMKRLNLLVQQNWAPVIGIEHTTVEGAQRALNLYVIRKGYTLDDVGG